jgi:hypothetical protein
VKAILRRVGLLEERYETQLSGKPQNRLRLVVSLSWKGPASLATSTCQRYLRGGFLTELVKLDGDDSAMSEEELERFIESFPIETAQGDERYRHEANYRGGRR